MLVGAEVKASLDKWAEAWANQDIAAYLDFYVPGYKSKYDNHKQWAKQRTRRIKNAKQIQIVLDNIEVISNDVIYVQVNFRQKYSASNYSDISNKYMELVKVKGGWKIIKEMSKVL